MRCVKNCIFIHKRENACRFYNETLLVKETELGQKYYRCDSCEKDIILTIKDKWLKIKEETYILDKLIEEI